MFTDFGLFLVGSLIICLILRTSSLDCRTAGVLSISQFRSPNRTNFLASLLALSALFVSGGCNISLQVTITSSPAPGQHCHSCRQDLTQIHFAQPPCFRSK
jgi:hypothetical protein